MKSLLVVLFYVVHICALHLPLRIPISSIGQKLTTLQNITSRNESRIIEGFLATEGQFPHQASLVSSYDQNDLYGILCGASIITHRSILTAASCVSNKFFFRISVGSTSRTSGNNIQIFQFSGSARIYPEYNPSNYNNNIAIVLLPATQRFAFNNFVQNIGFSFETLFNQHVSIAGWGRAYENGPYLDHLLWDSLRLISNAECNAYYLPGIVIDSTVCAVSSDAFVYRYGICFGDFGGAAITYTNGVASIVGVASFVSANGCESNGPNGFVRTTGFMNWIAANWT